MVCPSCGDDANPPGARFCENCGASLDPAALGLPKGRGCRCPEPDFDADGFCRNCGMKAPKAIPAVETEQVIDAALALASDRGRRHATNQDFGVVARRADGVALIVVADGVSASDNPEAASRAAAKAAERAFLKADAGEGPLSAEAQALAREAAEALLAIPIAERRHDGPASTIVIALARENATSGVVDVGLAWVGDSRAYFVAANVPETLLTRDDSWPVEQVESGRMTREEAMRSPNAHAISQWLGMPIAEMVVHAKDVVLTHGASLLLCSDGLWNYADEPSALARAFTDAAKDAPDAATICRALVGFANAAGGADNITVGLLRV
jgi:serine/threonine protein phosphatase PrpC